MKKRTLLLSFFLLFSIFLFSQIKLDVEGDTKIVGCLQLIATTVDSSIFIGFNTGINDDGTYKENVFIGNNAGKNNSEGRSNVFIGTKTGNTNNTGNFNTFLGASAGQLNETGANNVFLGVQAGNTNSFGTSNVFIGRFAGSNTRGNNSCTFVGYNARQVDDGSTSGYTNCMALGNQARATNHNSISLGNTSITSIKGQVSFTTYSDGRFKQEIKEDVPGLDFILKLRPVTYQVETEKVATFLGEDLNKNSKKGRKYSSKKDKLRHSGFIAQEVESVANEMSFNFSGIDKPDNKNSLYGLRYAEFVIPLVKGMQEQQETIQQLNSKIEERDKRINELESDVFELKELMKQVLKLNDNNVVQTEIIGRAKLGQNIPNPFNGNTRIPYDIPQTSQTASIQIHNFLGQLIKTVKIGRFGKGVLELQTSGLINGQYSYTLEVDGRVIETKKMNFNNK